MRRVLLPVVLAMLAALSTFAALAAETRAKSPPDETLKVSSLTLTTEQFLRGDITAGIPVVLTGELRFPNWDERQPVVVLLHGSNGFGGAAFRWAAFLDQLGVATLRLDSFGARGIDQVVTDQSLLNPFAQVYDVYRVVEVLSAHPRIDGSRIAIMGFSRGGVAALYTSMRRFRELYLASGAQIAAHLAFYPACNYALVRELEVSDAPIREFHGAADDWTSPAYCRDYIRRLADEGKDAVMTEYPAAMHSFDDPDSPEPYVVEDAENASDCRRREADGQLLNEETGKPFTYDDACVKRGGTVHYDKAATLAAQSQVKDLLTKLFRLK